MISAAEYLKVLGKVMRSKGVKTVEIDREEYNKLYYLLHDEFYVELRKSSYPYVADSARKYEEVMSELESLYCCPEIIGKKCVLISMYCTTGIFDIGKDIFLNGRLTKQMKNLFTQIPLIIVDSPKEDEVDIINYANERISLSVRELRLLVIESNKRKIALNKIIQYVIIKTQIFDPNLCIVSDNIYGKCNNLFLRSISQRIMILDSKRIKRIDKRHLMQVSALMVADEIASSVRNKSCFRGIPVISFNELIDYITNETYLTLYGIWEAFAAVATQIVGYYRNQNKQVKALLQAVTGDIVRLDGDKELTLRLVRKEGEERLARLEFELKKIENPLEKIDTSVVNICNRFGEKCITGKHIPRYVWDDIFTALFCCQNFDNGMGKKILNRIQSLGYGNYKMVLDYIQSLQGKQVARSAIEIESDSWEKARMLVALLDFEDIPKVLLEKYVKVLGWKCRTGKEFYAKALVTDDKHKSFLLQKSLKNGYAKAGLTLLDRYKNGDKFVNLLALVNSLVPEACMLLGKQKMQKHFGRERHVDLSNEAFTYYKIAAAQGSLLAIGEIVDVIFKSCFSTGEQVVKNKPPHVAYGVRKNRRMGHNQETMIRYGHLACQACRFLIRKLYKVEHYTEVLGIILFSLKEDLSESRRCLVRARSGLAYYCKGYMYEFGDGGAANLELAIKNYEEAMRQGFLSKACVRLDKCRLEKDQYIHKQKSNDVYQADSDYEVISREVSVEVDDGCLAPGTQILMADETYQPVESIKIGDKVVVYNHYQGRLTIASVIANVHDMANKKEYEVITLRFEDERLINLVQSHVLFDMTEWQYVWIDAGNAAEYVGHDFVIYDKGRLKSCKLLSFVIEVRNTRYYAPISKYHLNVFAEGLLTMPPTKLTMSLFDIKKDMTYDLSIVKEVGKTSYEEIKDYISPEEYADLPCEYLKSVLALRRCTMEDFANVMKLYRQQSQYILQQK